MSLNGGAVVGPPSTRTSWISRGTRIGVLALLFAACVTPPSRPRDQTGGEKGDGGGSGEGGSGGMSGSGGRGGSGGAGGAGGSTEKLDAAVKLDTSGGSGGTPDASARLDANSARLDAKLDGGKKETGASAAGTWEKLNLVLANCVFCHNDPDKRVDLQETGLYDRIVNKAAERIPAGCPTKTLIVPNDPMGSLLYLKLTGTMPAGCGERMPYKKPAVTQLELDFVLDWINAGAPPNP